VRGISWADEQILASDNDSTVWNKYDSLCSSIILFSCYQNYCRIFPPPFDIAGWTFTVFCYSAFDYEANVCCLLSFK
jgi:hypothetical protein